MERSIKISIGLLATGLFAVSPAHAETIELRMGDSLPPTHIISENLTKPWIKLVEEHSEGRVKIRYYPAEQMGKAKDMLSLTQSGILDVGYIGAAYVSDKMPLSAVAELPGSFENSCQIMKGYWELATEGGYLYENEFKPNGIRPLFAAILPPYQIVTAVSRPLQNLSDFEGLKVRAAGGAQDLTLRKLGMVPIKMAPPEIYESMSRGTIDGSLFPYVSVESYKLSPLVKYATYKANFGSIVAAYSISEKKWNTLPADIQAILLKAGDEATKAACVNFDEQESQAKARLEKHGVKFVEFDPAAQEVLHSTYNEIAENWAQQLDARNRPGSEALKAFREASAKALNK